ncbi:MAG TPA: type II toxin-antitoxin system RelE/ParE family toxin [Terriglobales bacterium]|nr:type II toxin-antitoxin system RelE/ParE family toxin [Terriglobales bacterium]
MAWTIELISTAIRQLAKLDKAVARRIRRFLQQRIAPIENPRILGQKLHGKTLGEFWKYRVGDYRIVAKIEDDRLVVLVIQIGYRSEI